MDNCCESMVKYFMFFINFIFALVGLCLIGIGAYIQISAKEYLDFLSDNYLNTPIFIIILGAIIFVVAFFGCCGAWYESSCMIYTYALLLSMLLIAEIGAGIAAFFMKGELKDVISTKMAVGMQNYGRPGHEGVTNAWDVLQTDLACCGATGYNNWAESNFTGPGVPDSCCKEEKKGCGSEADWESNINQNGCIGKFEDTFIGNIGIIGGVALGVAFIQLCGVIFSCCLGRRINKSSAYV